MWETCLKKTVLFWASAVSFSVLTDPIITENIIYSFYEF